MSLAADVAKIICFSLFLGTSNAETSPRLNFLVISDSISADCSTQQRGPFQTTFQMSDAEPVAVVRARPVSAECNAQSTWINLGRMLIERKHARKVVFTSIEIKDAMLSGLTGNGPPEMSLSASIETMRRNELRFDAVLFQQGPGDTGKTSHAYKSEFNNLVRSFSRAKIVAPWLIARHSRCGDLHDREIDIAQRTLTADFFTKFYFAGPNINIIDERMNPDGCLLNQAGEHRAAALWLQAYEAHRQLLERARREAMLFLFPK
jgi:hypothetical protein